MECERANIKNEPTADETTGEADPFAVGEVAQAMRPGRWKARWMAALLATVSLLAVWRLATAYPYVDADSAHYRDMADGRVAMKPFAFRVLAPAMARGFRKATGRPADDGFLVVGLVSGWVMLYGTILLVLERRQGAWMVIALIPLPFWLDSFRDYFLPDLPHAALIMIYLLLLRRRWWGWAAVWLIAMFLARESTLLVTAVSVPVLWWLRGRSVGLMQMGGALAGMAASKFAARHALPNQHHIDDTLYLIGKIPWNAAEHLLGVTLWSNTLHVLPAVRVWNVPDWMPLGNIHQLGYSAVNAAYPMLTAIALLEAFGLGTCVAICLVWRTPLRRLLPTQEPYLCVAAIYGATTFLLSPLLGAALPRLFAYGWPLFLVYLPAMLPRLWRHWPVWTVASLVVLHLVVAWVDITRMIYLHSALAGEFLVLLVCNLAAAWLVLRTSARTGTQGLAE